MREAPNVAKCPFFSPIFSGKTEKIGRRRHEAVANLRQPLSQLSLTAPLGGEPLGSSALQGLFGVGEAWQRAETSASVLSRENETRMEPSMTAGDRCMASSTWLRCLGAGGARRDVDTLRLQAVDDPLRAQALRQRVDTMCGAVWLPISNKTPSSAAPRASDRAGASCYAQCPPFAMCRAQAAPKPQMPGRFSVPERYCFPPAAEERSGIPAVMC